MVLQKIENPDGYLFQETIADVCPGCVVDAPCGEEHADEGGTAKSGSEAYPSRSHSLSGTMTAVAVISHASHFLAMKCEVSGRKIIHAFHNKRNLHYGQY